MTNRYATKPLHEPDSWASGKMSVIKGFYSGGVRYSIDFELDSRTYHVYELQYEPKGAPNSWKLLPNEEVPPDVLSKLAAYRMGLNS